MKMDKLLAKDIFGEAMECHYAFINSIKKTSGIHYHDFYELFVIIKGSTKHIVNEQSSILGEGTLMFIRPRDIHYYEEMSGIDCQLVNLAFSKNTFEAIRNFLGTGFSVDNLLASNMPSQVLLPMVETSHLKDKIESIYFSKTMTSHIKNALIRVLLVDIFAKYFIEVKTEKNNIPSWILDIKSQMELKNNFVKGISIMKSISGKSPEHINRMFVKYFNVTPTAFINELRVNYAGNLLIYTDEEILDIALEAGFQNLSHFYHVFKKINRVSPGEYRKTYKKTIIP